MSVVDGETGFVECMAPLPVARRSWVDGDVVRPRPNSRSITSKQMPRNPMKVSVRVHACVVEGDLDDV